MHFIVFAWFLATSALASPGVLAFQSVKDLIFRGQIDREEARFRLRESHRAMREEAERIGCSPSAPRQWVFPLQGYGLESVGGEAGEGFIASKHDYFDGNASLGHAAQDIFVFDDDQDGKDDRSGADIPVLSITGGLVVARSDAWRPGDPLRGGNYVYVYVPDRDFLLYYAHLDRIVVELGECIRPGALLGNLGRTGLNAQATRSPTHLHLSRYRLADGVPHATNPYRLLRYLSRASRRPAIPPADRSPLLSSILYSLNKWLP